MINLTNQKICLTKRHLSNNLFNLVATISRCSAYKSQIFNILVGVKLIKIIRLLAIGLCCYYLNNVILVNKKRYLHLDAAKINIFGDHMCYITI